MSDPATICDVSEVKARKRSRCCECRKPIAIGQPHERAHGLWEGIWETYRTCLPCRDLREAIRPLRLEAWRDDFYTYGDTRETIAELRTWSTPIAARVAEIVLQHQQR